MKRYVKGLLGAVLMGATLWLGGCATPETGIATYKDGCKQGRLRGQDHSHPNGLYRDIASLYDLGKEVLHNDCLVLAGAYRQQKNKVISLEGGSTILRINNSKYGYEVEEVDKSRTEKYLQMGIEQLRKKIVEIKNEGRSKCVMLADGGALNALRDEIYGLQLECVKDGSAQGLFVPAYSLKYDTPLVRAKLYEYADFTPKEIEEALRKDYALRAKVTASVCELHGIYFTDKYDENQFVRANPDDILKLCNEAKELYLKGASYNGVQVFAPNPNHPNIKIADKIIKTYENKVKEEVEYYKEQERQAAAEIAKEEQYRKNLKAAAAKDCKTKYKNAKICEVAAQEMLRLQLDKEGLDKDSQEMFDELKDEVASYNTQTLRAIVQEITNKPKHKYKGVSYCTSVMPYVWTAFYRNGSVSVPAAQYVAGVCGN